MSDSHPVARIPEKTLADIAAAANPHAVGPADPLTEPDDVPRRLTTEERERRRAELMASLRTINEYARRWPRQ